MNFDYFRKNKLIPEASPFTTILKHAISSLSCIWALALLHYSNVSMPFHKQDEKNEEYFLTRKKKWGERGWKIRFLAFAVWAPKLSKPSCSGNAIVMNTLLNMEESIEIAVKNLTCCREASNQMALMKYFSAMFNNFIFQNSGTWSKWLQKIAYIK